MAKQIKKPFDELDELEETNPELADEESAFGDEPNPEVVNSKDTLDREHEMGQYLKSDEEHPAILGTNKVLNPKPKSKKNHKH